ncbi:MAG TPA: hypothetical protein DEB39_07995 [Planctomycetaceae bacterium]|nr:hypothetical protein [Planctomycetaceae bacterium]
MKFHEAGCAPRGRWTPGPGTMSSESGILYRSRLRFPVKPPVFPVVVSFLAGGFFRTLGTLRTGDFPKIIVLLPTEGFSD